MKVEFDKSFEKWLSKVNHKGLLKKIEVSILQLESARSLDQLPNIKKLNGYPSYYRIKIGNYRIGFELIKKSTIRLLIVADRQDIYKKFPK